MGTRHGSVGESGTAVADIHVAGDSNINLRDVKMVFDTTGITYYHDMNMST